MGIKFTNNAAGELAAGISDSVTALTLKAGQGNLFPEIAAGSGDYFYATLVDSSGNREVIQVTERQAGSNVFATIVREVDGSTAQAWLTDDVCELRIPSIVFEEFETDIDTNTTNIATNTADIATNAADIVTESIASGTKMYFYQNVAPTNWTIDATVEDCLLAIKDQSTGGLDYDDTGGQMVGTWTATTHTHTGGAHTHVGASHSHTITHTHDAGAHIHGTSGHTLTTAEMPVHTHTVKSSLWQNGSGEGGHYQVDSTSGTSNVVTNSAGSGNSHTHGNVDASSGDTGASNSANTGAAGNENTTSAGAVASGTGSQPSTDRPLAALGIICTKD